MYTLEEIDAIRFYEGDIRIRGTDGCLMATKYNDEFWGDQKAYRTLNALLFPGIDNEMERIKVEGHMLNHAIVENIEATITIYCNVYTTMLKSASTNKSAITKRVERFESMSNLMSGETVSFTSTSKSSYNSDFSDKNGIALLEFHIPENYPYAELEKVLGKEYIYNEEKEVLLPPFTTISIKEGTLLHYESRLKDMNKKPPKAKYIIEVLENDFMEFESNADREVLKHIVLNKDNCEKARDMIICMNRGEWNVDFREYIHWKTCLQQYLKLLFIQIRKKIIE